MEQEGGRPLDTMVKKVMVAKTKNHATEDVLLEFPTPDVRNKFRVPVAQWRKWNDAARAVFNGTYDLMLSNQLNMAHPRMPPLEVDHWATICWNAAWIAADSYRDYHKAVKAAEAKMREKEFPWRKN